MTIKKIVLLNLKYQDFKLLDRECASVEKVVTRIEMAGDKNALS